MLGRLSGTMGRHRPSLTSVSQVTLLKIALALLRPTQYQNHSETILCEAEDAVLSLSNQLNAADPISAASGLIQVGKARCPFIHLLADSHYGS